VISSSKCGGLLFVVLCGAVWFPVFLRCSLDSSWKIDYSIKDLSVNVADPEAMNIPVTLILSYIFVGIMPLYAINLDAVSLFADSFFTFLAILNDVISRFESMDIILFLSKKKKVKMIKKLHYWCLWVKITTRVMKAIKYKILFLQNGVF